MLTQRQVVGYLLDRKLLNPTAIVDGDLSVADVSRRNCNFKVFSTLGPCYLIKQGINSDTVATVAWEAAVYKLLQPDSEARKPDFSRYLPHFYDYDPEQQILILELVPEAEDLRHLYTRHTRFSSALASQMGEALSALHRSDQGRSHPGFSLPSQVPWALSIHRPKLGMLRELSEANLQLISVIQQSTELCQLLDELPQDWCDDRLIHRDIRLDNWVLFSRSARKSGLKLIDWELAGSGDACWDVGSVLSSYLSFWLDSIPFAGDDPPDRLLEFSRYPLERMQPALRSFWTSYVSRMELDDATADQWLLKATKHAAARLIQTAFEQTRRMIHVTSTATYALQLCLNMLRQPREAAVLLLGIPLQHN